MSRPSAPDIDLDLPTPPPGPVTWEEFLAWTAAVGENIRAEWVDGEIEVMSPTTVEHARLALWLGRLLSEYIEPRGLGEILLSPIAVLLPDRRRGREPDVIFITTEHRDRLLATYIQGPVDLVVEIVSPESVERDTVTKRAEYAAGRIREYWLIDPAERSVIFYQLRPDGGYAPGAVDDAGVYRSAVIPGFWLRTDWLWQHPLPPIAAIRRLYAEA